MFYKHRVVKAYYKSQKLYKNIKTVNLFGISNIYIYIYINIYIKYIFKYIFKYYIYIL